MLNKYLITTILSFIAVGSIIGTAYALPTGRNEQDIFPFQNEVYNLGSSTKQWLNVFTKNITSTGTSTLATTTVAGELCLNNDCQDTWPTGGGESLWSTSTGFLSPTSTVTEALVVNTSGTFDHVIETNPTLYKLDQTTPQNILTSASAYAYFSYVNLPLFGIDVPVLKGSPISIAFENGLYILGTGNVSPAITLFNTVDNNNAAITLQGSTGDAQITFDSRAKFRYAGSTGAGVKDVANFSYGIGPASVGDGPAMVFTANDSSGGTGDPFTIFGWTGIVDDVSAGDAYGHLSGTINDGNMGTQEWIGVDLNRNITFPGYAGATNRLLQVDTAGLVSPVAPQWTPSTYGISNPGFVGIGIDPTTSMLEVKGSSTIPTPTFNGSGLNDATASGPYNGTDSSGPYYIVTIDANGTPDTFKWSKNGGAETTDVPITGHDLIADGVYVDFASLEGHTIGDAWQIDITFINPLAVFDNSGAQVLYMTPNGYLGSNAAATFGSGSSYYADLGNATNAWSGYFSYPTGYTLLGYNDTVKDWGIYNTGDTYLGGNLTARAISPETTDTYSLGDPSYYWLNGYITNTFTNALIPVGSTDPVANISTQVLLDSGGENSIDWTNRQMFNDVGSLMIDWQDDYGGVTINTNATTSGNHVIDGNFSVVENSEFGQDVTVTGNVGIGTTSPSQILGVQGSIDVQRSNGLLLTNGSNPLVVSTGTNRFLFDSPSNTTGATYNTGIGTNALHNLTTGDSNMAIGYDAMASSTTASNNTAIGNSALANNIDGISNVAIGTRAMVNATSNNYTIAIGEDAVRNVQKVDSVSGNYNVGIGYKALYTDTTGRNNVGIGYNALLVNNGSYNLAIGSQAMEKNTDGSFNVGVGSALYRNTTGDNNTAVGTNILVYSVLGDNNTVLGNGAMYGSGVSSDDPNDNVAIGYNALFSYKDSEQNIAIGMYAMEGTGTSTGNTALGYFALDSVDGGDYNIAIGDHAGSAYGSIYKGSVLDDYNIFIGYQASRDISVATSTQMRYSGSIGYQATVGCSNCFSIGNSSDSYKVKLGVNTSTPNAVLNVFGTNKTDTLLRVATSTNQNIFVIASTGNVGIGTSSPSAKLDVVGTLGSQSDLFNISSTTATNVVSSLFKVAYDGLVTVAKYLKILPTTTPSTDSGVFSFSNDRMFLTNVAVARPIDRSSDVLIASSTVSNTTASTTIYTGVIGANALKAGNVLELHLDGVLSNASAADDVLIEIFLGDHLVLAFKPAIGLVSDTHWHMDGNMTVYSTGTGGKMAYHLDPVINGFDGEEIGLGDIDTTAVQDFKVTVKWDNAKAGNIWHTYQGYTEWKN